MKASTTPHWVYVLQVISVSMIWVFVIGISVWIIHLLRVSARWNDVPSASVGISIVAIPVFLLGAGVLTYVFIGFRRGARPAIESEPTGEAVDPVHGTDGAVARTGDHPGAEAS